MTKYGCPQVVILPAVIVAIMIIFLLFGLAAIPLWGIFLVEVILAIILIWALAFFRDPYRLVPADKNILLSPADGKVTDIDVVEKNDFITGPVLRIGIFLSVFNVHINRAPCSVTVDKITYKKGKYKDARDPQASRVNESNDLAMTRIDDPKDKLIVRQISGAIARRIVCRACPEQKLTGGEKFGMIKFGSRTELYLPVRQNAKTLVKIGDKVKAGLTALVEYEIENTRNEKCQD